MSQKKQLYLASMLIFLLPKITAAYNPTTYPKGLILNLDFQNVSEGLIPNKSIYPLFVPIGNLRTQSIQTRQNLVLDQGQGLDIPHSSLLDPAGSTWIVSVRVVASSDGIIVAQGNATTGYVIYIQDGMVHAAVRSGSQSISLSGTLENGAKNIIGKPASIDLQIISDHAVLIVNRIRISTISLQQPLDGENLIIRLGTQLNPPAAIRSHPTLRTKGISGQLINFKILRQ